MDAGIAVIGAGLMGSALAKQLSRSGRRVTVWNRTPGRCDHLAEEGATVADTAADAISTTRAVIFCISNSADVAKFLETLPESLSLNGRCVVNLSTGSIEDAERIGELVAARRGTYVDGTILVYPVDIGTKNALIQYAGDASGWDSVQDSVRTLAPEGTLYLGERLDLPAVLDVALTGTTLGTGLTAFFEGAAYATSRGVDVELVAQGAIRTLGILQNEIRKSIDEIKAGTYETDQATLDVWRHGIVAYRDAIAAQGQPAFVLNGVLAALDDAKEKGYAESAYASQFATFRGTATTKTA
ncbi:3-hydroxyisobutyrate dehydrogenase [Amycolatopsis saalfeldensis]|uniref:3-hydroxyisobutyrate dehydrogenase n=2 Tax=Amycolatopsis saalfeldensis TaxID=394193 RepID=A0A1H8XY59_9PSEU|nr:3-hydroxyisobutyrate dehydrogenase [Amycolatopsis saalfeldensis]